MEAKYRQNSSIRSPMNTGIWECADVCDAPAALQLIRICLDLLERGYRNPNEGTRGLKRVP